MVKYQEKNIVEIISQNSNTIVVVINRLGEIIYVSQSVEKILAYKPEELLGEYWWRATRKNEISAIEMFDYFKKLVKENRIEELSTERMLFDSDGNKKWILWNSSLDDDGNVVSVGYDITKRKRNENRLKKSNSLLIQKNNEIIDSLNYAKSIQNSILPPANFYTNKFNEGFLIFQAKDIVSGDFYWYYEFINLTFIACIDCTGHGVPGALMTILANNLLKNVIKHQKKTNPNDILQALDELLFDEFNQNNKIQRADGMDISLCVFDFENKNLAFSGANHSLLIKKNNLDDLVEIKGERFPIGLYHDVHKKYVTTHISFEKGDQFFLFSDGIVDQFGGPKNKILGKKFTKKRFKEVLNSERNLEKLKAKLSTSFSSWKGKIEQTDDVLIIALEI
jgi:PAS domain S-box-containing protein